MEIMGISVPMAAVWGVLAILFAVIEAGTVSLTSIWFCGGAAIACLTSLITGSIPVQVAVFIVVAAVLIIAVKPVVNDKLKVGKTETNVNSLLNSVVAVTKDIAPLQPGEVKAGGLIWMATADVPIKKGTRVRIKKIDGVKLVVEEVE